MGVMQKLVPIKTRVGRLLGRTAIILDRQTCVMDMNRLILSGIILGDNCSPTKKDLDFPFVLKFFGVLGVQIYEPDTYPGLKPKPVSISKPWSFAEVRGSRWLRTLGKEKLTPEYRHLWCWTYDYVF